MAFNNLCDFIARRMRMSHIYQPVMLMTLLENGGECKDSEIAKSILVHDQSQIEYYEKVVRDMVGRVLRNRGIVHKEGRMYKLIGYENLSPQQVQELIQLCKEKLIAYLDRRGSKVWQHRKQTEGYISGTLRYEVLKAAKFHCELCGISAGIRALEVDHIFPRSRGGGDDMSNLQALCYSCNAMKRDRDDTDFRMVRESYKHREPDCIFCEVPERNIILQEELAYAIYDSFPVTDLHSLVIPKRHMKTYFDLSRPELNACNNLLHKLREIAQQRDSNVTGFNIGMNNGEAAGQTVSHIHIHLIPRRNADVENPSGGVRHVIPGKGDYR